jgi:hypothetical protein
LDSLPPTVSQETQAEVLAATGTDDRQLSAAHAQRLAQGAGRETVQFDATRSDGPAEQLKKASDSNPLESNALCVVLHADVTAYNERRRSDSNRRWRICNPLP